MVFLAHSDYRLCSKGKLRQAKEKRKEKNE